MFLLSLCLLLRPTAEPIPFNYLATYSYSYKTHLKKDDRKVEQMQLYFSETHSYYISPGSYFRDTTTQQEFTFRDGNAEQNKNFPDRGLGYRIVKDRTAGTGHFYQKVSSDWYSAAYQPDELQWQLTEGDTTISGYACAKATADYKGRSYTAWFTFELPIPDGPYKFGGLPGLILALYDTEREHVWELISLAKVEEEIDLSQYENATEASLKEIRASKANMIKNLLNGSDGDVTITIMDDNGNDITDEKLREFKNPPKRNYIERED